MNMILTPRALARILERLPLADDVLSVSIPTDGSWDVLSHSSDHTMVYCAREDSTDSMRLVVCDQSLAAVQSLDLAARRSVFERMLWVARAVERPPVRLPDSWREYHHGNLLAYFACARNVNLPSTRWIVEIKPAKSNDVVFWRLTTSEARQALAEFEPPFRQYHEIVGSWSSASRTIAAKFEQLGTHPDSEHLQDAVDLQATVLRPITRQRTYSQWLPLLSSQQSLFLTHPIDHPLKLRGPAGSGKTLALTLKALRELYKARDEGRSVKILFATHSWAAAEQIQSTIEQLNDREAADEIVVFPLLQVATLYLPSERSAQGFEVLGEDSLFGKLHQLRRIDETLQTLLTGEWITLRGGVSSDLRNRIETPRQSADRNALVWDLMIEFSSVLASNGILPGLGAERKYLALSRESWMMPLPTEADKNLVLRLYSDYVDGLRQDGLITSDQVITDFLTYLETFAWNLRREREGFDLICVDEFQLFNEQERMALQYLSRSSKEYPRLLLALDPRQAPYEVFPEFRASTVRARTSGASRQSDDDESAVDLTTTYRFTPQILDLVRHFQRSYPTVELGEDWRFRLDEITSSGAAGARPTVTEHATQIEEVDAAVSEAMSLNAAGRRDERVALILLDPQSLVLYEQSVTGRAGFVVLRGRDDGLGLRYSRRAIVLSTAEAAAGLQFDHVVIAGFPAGSREDFARPHQMRRLVTLLYIAVSRAARSVALHVNDATGGLPELLVSAVEAGFLTRDPAGHAA